MGGSEVTGWHTLDGNWNPALFPTSLLSGRCGGDQLTPAHTFCSDVMPHSKPKGHRLRDHGPKALNRGLPRTFPPCNMIVLGDFVTMMKR